MENTLFKTYLNYHINANVDNPEDEMENININEIDLHKCSFEEFKKVLLTMQEENPDYHFRESSLDSVKPTDYTEAHKYDFVELTDFAKHTAVGIGNMALFSDLQKIAGAIELFREDQQNNEERLLNVIPFEDYNNYSVKNPQMNFEEIGSCVVGGGDGGAFRIAAGFHESSTIDKPIIAIKVYTIPSGGYTPNQDIIDLENIYKPHATLMETFAYMSYKDYLEDKYNESFDKLLISGAYELDTLDDMYNETYDLTLFDHINK